MNWKTGIVVSASVLLAGVAFAQDAAPGKPAQTSAEATAPVYDEQADGAEQIAAALARAKKENRRVLIQWGANWCGWCIKLHDLSQSDREIRRRLMYEYDVVHIDVGKFDKHMDLAAKYGADLKGNGVPFLTVLDAAGNPVANQETGELENPQGSTPAHNVEKVMAFLTEHQAGYLSATAVLDDALARAKAEGKLALVHFGAPWCPWCHRLDAFLARDDVKAILDDRFVEVKIDTDRMLGGGEMLMELRKTQQGGIPWFAFLDGEGEIVAHSSEAGKNIGYPAAPDEADAFLAMLRKACPGMPEERLALLKAALVASVKPQSGN